MKKIFNKIKNIVLKNGEIDHKDNICKCQLQDGEYLCYNLDYNILYVSSDTHTKLYFKEYHRVLIDEYEKLLTKLNKNYENSKP